jgi:hypothetical protein
MAPATRFLIAASDEAAFPGEDAIARTGRASGRNITSHVA